MNLFHFRHKWGEVKEGFQRCEICGVARPVPCSHIWETKDEYRTSIGSRVISVDIIQRCKHCGTLKTTKIPI